jgi:hypothetical protein
MDTSLAAEILVIAGSAKKRTARPWLFGRCFRLLL